MDELTSHELPQGESGPHQNDTTRAGRVSHFLRAHGYVSDIWGLLVFGLTIV
jgi:hypothetical protein